MPRDGYCVAYSRGVCSSVLGACWVVEVCCTQDDVAAYVNRAK